MAKYSFSNLQMIFPDATKTPPADLCDLEIKPENGDFVKAIRISFLVTDRNAEAFRFLMSLAEEKRDQEAPKA